MLSDWKKLGDERIWLTVIFCGGLVWIFGSFFTDLSFPESDYDFPGATSKAKLDPGKPITQIFEAKENNLNQVKIIIGNADLRPTEKIVLELTDALCETTIANATRTFLSPEPHVYSRLNFPAIPDSAGKKYCFKITYFSDQDKDRPFVGASEGEQFIGQSYYNEGNGRIYENRTLQMRPAYGTSNTLSDLSALIDRMSQYKPGFLKGSALVSIFGLFLFGTLSLFYFLAFRKEDEM